MIRAINKRFASINSKIPKKASNIANESSPTSKIVFRPNLSANYPAIQGATVRQIPVNKVEIFASISFAFPLLYYLIT